MLPAAFLSEQISGCFYFLTILLYFCFKLKFCWALSLFSPLCKLLWVDGLLLLLKWMSSVTHVCSHFITLNKLQVVLIRVLLTFFFLALIFFVLASLKSSLSWAPSRKWAPCLRCLRCSRFSASPSFTAASWWVPSSRCAATRGWWGGSSPTVPERFPTGEMEKK